MKFFKHVALLLLAAGCAVPEGGGDATGGCPALSDVYIRSVTDWETFTKSGCTSISGDLVITAPNIERLLGDSQIVEIGGRLVMASPHLTHFSLPSLVGAKGGIEIHGPALASLHLPSLAMIEGTAASGGFELSGNRLTSVELASLRMVAGNLSISASSLPELNIPLLVTVNRNANTPPDGTYGDVAAGGGMTISGPESVNLPALESVRKNIAISGSSLSMINLSSLQWSYDIDIRGTALSEINLPSFRLSHGGLDISNNENLKEFRAPILAEGDVKITHNDMLEDLDISALTRSARLRISSNRSLQSIELLDLESIYFEMIISNNDSLMFLDASSLREVSKHLSIVENQLLPECLAVRLKDQLTQGPEFTWRIEGNDESAECD